jgi:putative tryptophan/tyrosine transport system permease protein
MTLALGALTIGVILALLALGVLISFRIFSFPDLTAEGSVTLGAAVAAAMIVAGYNPVIATVAAAGAGALAGATTGILHTRFRINGLLAGILVMTALYSINLHVMGRSNLPLMSTETFATWAAALGERLSGGTESVQILGREANVTDLTSLGASTVLVVAVCALLFAFFRTQPGTAMRATGDNPQMIRALGVSDGNMITAGLALSNALVALAGALLAQYQGFADVQMGIGMLVWGLASVIIGEALIGTGRLGHLIAGAVLGSVLFRLLVAVALRWGLDPNDLKLITAGFVLLALIFPGALANLRRRAAAAETGRA